MQVAPPRLLSSVSFALTRPFPHARYSPPRTTAALFSATAQVTNPPIDPLREGIVMGLDMSLGRRGDLRDAPAPELADQLRVESPILNAAELEQIGSAKKVAFVSTVYPISTGPDGLKAAVDAYLPNAYKQAKVVALRIGDSVMPLPAVRTPSTPAPDYWSGYFHHDRCGRRLKAFLFLYGYRPLGIAFYHISLKS